MTDQAEQVKQAAEALASSVEAIAKPMGLTEGATLEAVVKAARKVLGDGRSIAWRARVRLYSAADDFSEPQADSDADLTADAPGSEVCRGLGGVADYLAQLAVSFHNGQCKGLDTATLDHRLKSLRPTISRRGGNATWRVPYSTLEHIGETEVQRDWLARVDVERVGE